jgi:predicted HAD superfamily Cof-like phosphohydrolase
MVQEWHDAFGCQRNDKPTLLTKDEAKLRIRLIQEEFWETIDAVDAQNLPNIAKELADLLYVVYGMADIMGIPIDLAFQHVHASNMSKLYENGLPIRREDGKILKGPNYKEPDLSWIS